MDKHETFREFFKRRNLLPFPAIPGEMTEAVMKRMAETMADWMDELARRLDDRSK